MRHPDQAEVVKLKKRLENCVEAAAKATGCTYKLKWIMQYLDMRNNGVLASEYKRYMESEQKMKMPVTTSAFGSTDFVSLLYLPYSSAISRVSRLKSIGGGQGDVTYALPGLHPMFAIPVGPGEGNHTP